MPTPPKLRPLNRVSEQELLEAVTEMCARLNVSLSSGSISLWQACLAELEKSRQPSAAELEFPKKKGSW